MKRIGMAAMEFNRMKWKQGNRMERKGRLEWIRREWSGKKGKARMDWKGGNGMDRKEE